MHKRGKQMSESSMALGRETAHEDSFVLVFRVHRDYVYRLAYLLLNNAEDAEDVTQEVFLRLYRALPAGQPERASLRTWLTRVVVNACHTHRRRNFLHRLWRRRPAEPDDEEGNDAILAVADPSPWGMPEGQALQAELRQTLQAILTRLRPEHRAVLVLHYYLDLSCPEIARILDCPEGTVYSRLHYARRLVQARLEQAGPPGR
jgi:RNA polymerase sigma-70 factor (ECF subfamily)